MIVPFKIYKSEITGKIVLSLCKYTFGQGFSGIVIQHPHLHYEGDYQSNLAGEVFKLFNEDIVISTNSKFIIYGNNLYIKGSRNIFMIDPIGKKIKKLSINLKFRDINGNIIEFQDIADKNKDKKIIIRNV